MPHLSERRRTRRNIIVGRSVTQCGLGKQPSSRGRRRICPACGTSCPAEAVCIVCFEPPESRQRFAEEEVA